MLAHLARTMPRRLGASRRALSITMEDTSVSARFREPDPAKPRIVLAYSGGLDTSTQLARRAAPQSINPRCGPGFPPPPLCRSSR